MNRAFYLGLVAVMAVANAIEFVAAEYAALIDADDLTDSERIADARHLRGIQKTDDEERVGVPAAAWYATHV
ncbi:secreted RxLR effector peptide protein, putative, partial [Phytophthora infestans T30-4]